MLQLDALKNVISVEPRADGQPGADVTVQAGIRVFELNNILLEKSLALPNTGAIAQQSIAGATQTSTHGTGKELGSMATTLVGMRLVLANGTVLDVSESVRPDILKVARVGLGALGIVVRVTVRTVPAFKLKRTATPYVLSELMPAIPQIYDDYERMQWYWTPHTQNATLLLREAVPLNATIIPCWPTEAGNRNQSDARPAAGGIVVHGYDPLAQNEPSAPHAAGSQFAQRHSGRALRSPFGAHPPAAGASAWTGGDSAVPNGMPTPSGPSTVCVDWSFKALAHPADDPIRYTEEEYFVPLAKAQALIQQVNQAEAALPVPPSNPQPDEPDFSLFTGMRYVQADDVPLSPMFGQDIGVVSVITLGTANRTGPFSVFHQYADTLASLAKPYGGRWHWGKWNDATAEDTARVYPAAAISAFEAVRRELDPTGLLLNFYLEQRLPGVPGS